MLGLNNIQIIGNLGGTPDLKFLNDGKSQVVNFSVAVNERWKNRDGDPQERTTWLRVVAFNGIGQACAEHLTKGDGVYVEGRLQIREYEDKDGNERTSVEVVAWKGSVPRPRKQQWRREAVDARSTESQDGAAFGFAGRVRPERGGRCSVLTQVSRSRR